VAQGINEAIVSIQAALPKGVTLRTVYDQSVLVRSALGGVGRAVLVGAVFVAIVLFVLLGDLRGATIVTLTIPASFAIAGILLRRLGVGLNTMTLEGLAIAVGLAQRPTRLTTPWHPTDRCHGVGSGQVRRSIRVGHARVLCCTFSRFLRRRLKRCRQLVTVLDGFERRVPGEV